MIEKKKVIGKGEVKKVGEMGKVGEVGEAGKVWRGGRSPERILAFGIMGVGKSHAALQIAEQCHDITIFVVDNDNAWDKMLENYQGKVGVKEEFRGKVRDTTHEVEWGNVVLFHTKGWEEDKWALENIKGRARRNDWVVLDSVTVLWDEVQTWYVEKVYGTAIDQYFMQIKQQQMAMKDGKKHTAAEALFLDWGFINPQYKTTVTDLLLNPPGQCHLYMTAEMDIVQGDEKDKETREMYGVLGFKPKGQKRIGHNAQSVLYMKKKQGLMPHDMVRMLDNRIKDRGREVVVDGVWENFFMDYLVKVQQWKQVDK